MVIRSCLKRCYSIWSLNKVYETMEDKNAKKFSVDIGAMRIKYNTKNDVFTEKDLISKEPIAQFKNWFDLACVTPGILEANAMCLCTCTTDGYPSARYVLLKGYGKDGFKFYTNYSSRKACELIQNPRAALVFYWEPLKRSIRIEGTVEKLSEKESDEYFHSRPKASQIGACASHQSQVIESRDYLASRERQLRERYMNEDIIPRPNEWGGFKVIPHSIEFWQGQSDRLHDRIRFRQLTNNDVVDEVLLHKGEDNWVYERLSP